ncbi:hypothetical protein CDIOL_25840 [Clostridium diolis]|uniref:4Fe-4S ferredoxin-type domain-containing protein n=1 Tax=Clostridium diolis TaxID=223919 RepID=A0AAV3W3J7_9CLOT|nr:hypothetical protein CDIOL_25840 [Clostridium diolis]
MTGCCALACPFELLEHAKVSTTCHLEPSSEIFIVLRNKNISDFGRLLLNYSFIVVLLSLRNHSLRM